MESDRDPHGQARRMRRRSPSAPRLWWVGTFAGAFLGCVLLFAVWAKALDPAAFADQIHTEKLDFLLSAQGVALIALALEAGLGLALLLGVRRTVGARSPPRCWSPSSSSSPAAPGGSPRTACATPPSPAAASATWCSARRPRPSGRTSLLLVPPLLLAWVGARAPAAALPAGAHRRGRPRHASAVLVFAWKAPGAAARRSGHPPAPGRPGRRRSAPARGRSGSASTR